MGQIDRYLFRGKSIDTKTCNSMGETTNGSWLFGMPLFDMNMQGQDTCQIFSKTGAYKVDPTTVGQFTGLVDKNGVKIFEGDLLKTQYSAGEYNITQVEFTTHGGYYGWMLKVVSATCGIVSNVKYCALNSIIEITSTVIGNIHDNPELLK